MCFNNIIKSIKIEREINSKRVKKRKKKKRLIAILTERVSRK